MKSPSKVPKILVVEDDHYLSELLYAILEREGYRVRAAYDGKQALELAGEDAFDLITLNVAMPALDGFEVCRRLKGANRTKKIPIIFLSGHSEAADIVRAYDLGAEHYITKPFDLQVLIAQIRRSLKGSVGVRRRGKVKRRRNPRVFISYKWQSDDHNEWVMKLALGLRTAGLNVSLDQWGVRFGDSFIDYMTSKIREADVVLFIMTTASVMAVEAGDGKGGGVKFEIKLALSRKIAGENVRIIPIYREGDEAASYIKDHRYADFRDDSRFQSELQRLIWDLRGDTP
jgi:DNA-binding response OmpR family regulator